jgi:hypothetical protein
VEIGGSPYMNDAFVARGSTHKTTITVHGEKAMLLCEEAVKISTEQTDMMSMCNLL